jgi:hypothetical protein
MLHIELDLPDMGIASSSEPRFITTKYKKDLLIDKIPNITRQYNPAL